MEKMCGLCSQEAGMIIEDRIELALSRVPRVIYKCPICENNHSLHWIPGDLKRKTVQEISSNQAKSVNGKKRTREEQLTLF
ncbi:hypothetical protein SKN87_27065 (plasmid) [Paenibacillus polymyxa]|uniref:Uncharacterized protein n=2 Tax=Paenibacillus polymyxa TaxID=1406 RepID=E3EKW0_PAEPS|nr:hypothetical protein [Paenibacillus polymyxa]ADO59865.1 hypothetical protein PPSC2_25865 [Paenibacillus polymyxa SC2]WPQ59907.1 hypothetical protein SKN87_27065 [Paenibacillus polymyxa]